jgi:predicted TIM-barrel fold metal-dependent hydrolase
MGDHESNSNTIKLIPNKSDGVSTMIIDAHTHLGYDHSFEKEFMLEELLSNMEKNKIDACVLQPGTCINLQQAVKQHNAISKLNEKMPERIYGMANPNPHLSLRDYRNELKRCVDELGFVAVKLHPFAHAVNPNNKDARKIFETALELNIPVMVHTGAGIPWSLPSMMLPIALEFPDLKIILAHCGTSIFSIEAAMVASMCSNVYLETSWLPGYTIKDFCGKFGADRVMLGSDHGSNMEAELCKYRSLGLVEEDLEYCLGKTAAQVFDIPYKSRKF